MLCHYNNPEVIAAAKAARQQAGREAQSMDDLQAVAESTWDEWMPPCRCNKCMALDD